MSKEPMKMIGLNHIVLEVGDLDKALEFYGAVFAFELRGRNEGMAFLDMGDQFLVLAEGKGQTPDAERHFGLVVEDRTDAAALVQAAGGEMLDTGFVDFHDPWGNRVQLVEYRDLQFTKTPGVMKKLNADPAKTEEARQQIIDKDMA
ncbi:MAG: VOC family protein [Sulfitobacter sp.]|nr:VOC family protein [Sulfitobacter sp.]